MERMLRHKSANCAQDGYDHASVMFSFDAKAPDGTAYSSFMMSCQKDNLTQPDAATLEHMKAVARESVGDDVSIENVQGVILGARSDELSAQALVRRRMASNCAPGFRLKDVTSYNKFSCNYMGNGEVDGKTVTNPYQSWRGTLPSCEGGMELDKETMRDIKRIVHHNAGGDEAKLDVDKFICHVTSVPLM